MICKTFIDAECEEMVTIYAHERTRIVADIERIVNGSDNTLIGYLNNNIYKLDTEDIHCFAVEDNKVYAYTEKQRMWVKERLYNVENTVGNDFIKINQSCIVNVKKIERFEVTFAGALMIVLKNGYKDYVSRRQLKFVKERIGFRI